MYVLTKDEVERAILTFSKRTFGAAEFGPTTTVVLLPDGGAQLYTDIKAGPESAPEQVTAAAESTVDA
jgi:hypothetical protein